MHSFLAEFWTKNPPKVMKVWKKTASSESEVGTFGTQNQMLMPLGSAAAPAKCQLLD